MPSLFFKKIVLNIEFSFDARLTFFQCTEVRCASFFVQWINLLHIALDRKLSAVYIITNQQLITSFPSRQNYFFLFRSAGTQESPRI